ncbi:N-acetylmuramoyl-L-alanine amidase [Bacillus pseudomycoides]|uniref:N-acetylmuramoyl-L-alanine amidase n=1 Tax=Bacillus pseudomycoides TaxID=64104 RepID=A0A2A8BYT4_9BACI|nr:N-acetylmuramoyl-L-alanine amidase [Bacillus pseudomycoides]PEM65344.1 N-acetylmuramoyl-L-alanine amidase [Bacillus pseudomycoides]
MVKIWIDAGHGSQDSGAVGNGLAEKNIVLNLAKQLQEILENQYNITVGMTRTTDTFLSLSARADKANAFGADAFVSLHCNSGGGYGFETFRMEGVNDARTVAFQKAIHDKVRSAFGSGTRDRGMKTANYAVLRETNMIAVLTENLFMDNTEILRFNDPNFSYKIAQAHADGIAAFFGLKPAVIPEISYRIAIGDFNDVTWLESTKAKIREIYPAYGLWSNEVASGVHRIFVGDFNNEAWKDEVFAKLKATFPAYGMWVLAV